MTMSIEEDTTSNKSCWINRTNFERKVLLLLAISFLFIISLIIGLALVSRKFFDGNRSICLTDVCVQEAATLLNSMNPSIDPCEDFYEFSCGNFIKTTSIPAEKSEVGHIATTNDLIQRQIKALIERPSKSGEPKPFKMMKDLYKSCINVSLIEEDNLKTARSFIQDLGGWPVLYPRSWKPSNWLEITQKLRRLGLPVNHFFDLGVETDPANSTQQILILDQVELEVSTENLENGFDDVLVNVFSDYMVDLAVMFGANRGFAQREVKNVMNFRMKIANASISSDERRNKSALIHRMTISELQMQYPRVSWLELINNILDLPNRQASSEDSIIVVVPKYVEEMEELLARTPERIQVNHILFTTIRLLNQYLPIRFRLREQQHNRFILGTSVSPSRDDECAAIASQAFSLVSSSLYVQKFFKKETKVKVQEMVKYIRNEFDKIINQVEWMDSETKIKAIRKAQEMEVHIGYPDELLDERNLEEYYSGLEIDSDNLLKSITNILRFGTDKTFRSLWKAVNKSDWSTRLPANTVNAIYHPSENSIQLPAGILQGIFFANGRPNYMNYGSIGWIIGHEITHGFDDQGKQYDENGNLINWWPEETDENFSARAQCMVDQYSNYSVPEISLNINGVHTQSENIADNGGLKQAYLAYNSWLQQNEPEPSLPGLFGYTTLQLFWITAANTWCAKQRKEELEQTLLIQEHSPERFRVIGSFSNSEYFVKDFQCPVGSKMNSLEKCSVW